MYYNPSITKEGILDRLHKFDEEIYLDALNNDELNYRFRVDIVGSCCLLLNEINIPVTEDIDIVRITAYVSDELLQKYDMNTRASGLVNFLPYNYEDRMIKFNINTKIVDYYILSLEDAVVAKIVAARQKDDDHLMASNLAQKIHWPTLKICMEEIKLSLLNEKDYTWMVNRYNNYCRRHEHEEVIISNI